jgi:hypothetical protein
LFQVVPSGNSGLNIVETDMSVWSSRISKLYYGSMLLICDMLWSASRPISIFLVDGRSGLPLANADEPRHPLCVCASRCSSSMAGEGDKRTCREVSQIGGAMDCFC